MEGEGPMMSSPLKKDIIVSEEGSYEESGWTDYLEDFSSISSPSLVSDAAWNGGSSDNLSHVHLRRLNLIKRNNINHHHHRSKYSYGDDDHDRDLEDTASSPVNSPKVSSMKQMEVNFRRSIDHDHHVAARNFLGKQVGATNNLSEVQLVTAEENNGKNICIDLRKRGLCLVPMSTVINFMG